MARVRLRASLNDVSLQACQTRHFSFSFFNALTLLVVVLVVVAGSGEAVAAQLEVWGLVAAV